MGDNKDFTIAITDSYESVSIEVPENSVANTVPPVNVVKLVSNILSEWTPLLLVLSYFVFSVCIYLVCSEGFIAVFWFIYVRNLANICCQG